MEQIRVSKTNKQTTTTMYLDPRETATILSTTSTMNSCAVTFHAHAHTHTHTHTHTMCSHGTQKSSKVRTFLYPRRESEGERERESCKD